MRWREPKVVQYPFAGWEGIIGVRDGLARIALPQSSGQSVTVAACDWVWPYAMPAVAKPGGEARVPIANSHPTREFLARWVYARAESPLGVAASTLERMSLLLVVEKKVVVRLPLDLATRMLNNCYFAVNGLEDFYVRIDGNPDRFDVVVDVVGAYKAPGEIVGKDAG